MVADSAKLSNSKFFFRIDSINILRREKLDLIVEQNEFLETRIQERTLELEKSIKELSEAQDKLIRSEKMTVLGQLSLESIPGKTKFSF